MSYMYLIVLIASSMLLGKRINQLHSHLWTLNEYGNRWEQDMNPEQVKRWRDAMKGQKGEHIFWLAFWSLAAIFSALALIGSAA